MLINVKSSLSAERATCRMITRSMAQITRVEVIKNLRVFLNSKLRFSAHIDRTISKCHSMLRLIKRFARQFKDPLVHRRLYCTLVRPLLDDVAPVWSRCHQVHINRIKVIQKKFLLSFFDRQRLLRSYALQPYKLHLAGCNLDTIVSGYNAACVILVYGNLMGRTRYPGIRGKIQLNPKHRDRRSKYLAEIFHRTDYGRNEPINKCITNHQFSSPSSTLQTLKLHPVM